MLTRRELLKLAGCAFAATRFPMLAQAGSLKKILVLGGTGFLGPHIVQRAIERGHTVTLFNRGQSGKDLFPQIEKIRGDREPGGKGDLSGLKNDRKWDAVIDVWANDPEVVMPIANLLAHRTDYYYFVSSIAAFAEFSKIGMDETAPTRPHKPGYGGNKARPERGLQNLFAEHVGICRPCAILGPNNEGLAYHFWLSRLAQDREIVAPGSGDDAFVQYIDVRDVAVWIVDSVEKARSSIYNVLSLPTPFRAFLQESQRGIDGKAKLVWVSGDVLRKQHKVGTFNNMPFWNPDRPGFDQISSAKARAAGFSNRPLATTAKDSWKRYQNTVPPDLKYPQNQDGLEWGISVEREREILAVWKRKKAAD